SHTLLCTSLTILTYLLHIFLLVCSFSFSTSLFLSLFFFFNDTATTEIYTLSLHDALPISAADRSLQLRAEIQPRIEFRRLAAERDRKSTRLNSSHVSISYAVFCLKKKKKKKKKKNKII